MMRVAGFVLAFFVTWAAATAAEGPAAKPGRLDGMGIRKDRPRIFIDAAKLAWLKEKTKGKSLDEIKAMAGTSATGKALVYAMTGDQASGREAVETALPLAANEQTTVQMAICYDWCNALLSDAEKDVLKTKMIKAARDRMNFGRNWRSFHNGLYSSAWPVTAVTIALYHDDPFAEEAFAFLKPQLEDVLKMFDILFPDGEYHEGVDYNRHSTYEALRFFLALKTATGVDVLKDSPHMRNTGLFILYGQKPDGLNMPLNDNDWPFMGWWERAAVLMVAEEYKDGYCQYMLNHCPVLEFQPMGRNKWMELLWYDPTLQEKPLGELPMSRIFRGQGLVIARSGWGWDTAGKRSPETWLTFHCGDYFGDHCHYDINSFTIYHKGELALDSGRYDPDWDLYADADFVKSQLFNYYHRTMAHNTILVYDPDEKFSMPILNDGGQRQMLFKNGHRNVPEDYEQGNFPSDDGVGTCDWATNPGRWETGDIKGYMATGDFMYVCGDGTKAYSEGKVKSFVRQLVFVRPDVVVVFDRVVSTKPEFKKTWLLHTVNEPAIAEDGHSFEATYGDGRIVCIPILPQNRTLTKVGIPGNKFLVNGKEFGWGLASSVSQEELHYADSITGEKIGELPGKWRVEESPAAAAAEDYFLNVLFVSDKDSKDLPNVTSPLTGKDWRLRSAPVTVTTKDGRSATISFSWGDGRTMLQLKKGDKVLFDGVLPDTVEVEKGRPW